MFRFSARFAASLVVVVIGVSRASLALAAEQCTLKLMATLPMTDDGSGAFTVPVSVNGESHQFLVDTGGVYPSVAEKVAQQQQLKEQAISTEIYSAKGNRFKSGVVIDSLKLGNNEVKHIHMFIHDGLQVDGTLAPNLLQVFDVELDFANAKMNLFSQDHCPGKVVYWAKEYASIPFKMPDGFHIVVPVTLDGHTMEAAFDTGASATAISEHAVQALFGVGVVHADATNGAGQDQNLHHFESLSFGGVEVKTRRSTRCRMTRKAQFARITTIKKASTIRSMGCSSICRA